MVADNSNSSEGLASHPGGVYILPLTSCTCTTETSAPARWASWLVCRHCKSEGLQREMVTFKIVSHHLMFLDERALGERMPSDGNQMSIHHSGMYV